MKKSKVILNPAWLSGLLFGMVDEDGDLELQAKHGGGFDGKRTTRTR